MTDGKLNERKAPKEPLIRIVKRAGMVWWQAWLLRIGSFALAMALTTLLVWLLIGLNPIAMLKTVWEGAFGGASYLWPTLKSTAKLLLIAVALAPAFKMHFWNIGAEGQVLMGGMAAAFVMHNFVSLPAAVLYPLMVVASIAAGALWGLLPGFFRAKFGTNETLFTLMMNYVAMKLVDYFYNAWRGVKSSLGMLNSDLRLGANFEKGYLRYLWGDSDSFLANEDVWYIAVAVILAVIMYFYLAKTKHGYEIAVVGESRNTARYAGISTAAVMIRTMILSGAVAGICGLMTVTAQTHTISSATAGGFGFTAIIVCWLSQFNTLVMGGVSLLIVALQNGTRLISNSYTNFSTAAADVVVGIVLLFIIGCEFFINYRLVFRKSAKEETK